MDAFFDTDGVAFGMRMSPPVRELVEAHLKPERVLASRDGGEVVGTAVCEPSVMTLPGLSRLPVGMVLAVSVVPSHRRQGRLTALMARQLDELRERGEALATLFASEGGIYGRFGYGMATFGSRYEIDKRLAQLDGRATDMTGGRVRLVDRLQASEAFSAVYAEYAPNRAGEVDRSELDFLNAVGDPGAEDLSRRFYAVYEEHGRIDGYVAYEVAPTQPPLDSWPRRVICHELCHLTTASYVGLWQFLLGIDLVEELRAPGRPLDEPIRWLLTDHRHLKTMFTGDRSWIRLVEVETALAGRLYPQRGTLVLDVNDDFCSWNSGRYRLHVADEWAPAEVERTEAAADIELDVSALASIYLGGVAPSAFRVSERVRERSAGALGRADRMFANDCPPYCLTNF
jgi:predicted acetyltransferase